ncbi:MAG: GHKL domain-containing protein, partial [bacterium]|nr:GHKL domain-containing protein [bacterium]
SARVMGKALCITMDNSFNGQLYMENGELLSHKRHETGIGLMSIRSVAEKSGGNAEFKAEDRVFLSNVMVKL